MPVVAKSPEEAAEHFGWLGHFVGIDCPPSSAQTQERLGWRPVQPGLIADIDRARYFGVGRAAEGLARNQEAAPVHR